MISRRSFFTGAAATLITAPAIVRVGSLMPVKAVSFLTFEDYLAVMMAPFIEKMQQAVADAVIYGAGTMYHHVDGEEYGVTLLGQPIQPVERYGFVRTLLIEQGQINGHHPSPLRHEAP